MTVFRSDLTRYTSSSATSQHYTNADFRGKPNPALNRPLEESRIILNRYDLNLFADPTEIAITSYGVYSHWPADPRNPLLDITFDCAAWDGYQNPIGIPSIVIECDGSWINKTIFADPIEIAITAEGVFISGLLITSDSTTINISAHSAGMLIGPVRCNWIKWSKIGSLDFTIDHSNIANEQPLDQYGCVYKILKLDHSPVAYGAGGVTALMPKGIAYGMKKLYGVGLLGKSAVAGTDTMHFFIDNSGKLFKVSSSGVEEKGYAEYLSLLNDPVMSIDQTTNLLHICDGTLGFIYNTKDESFGSGITNLTGIGSKGSNRYATTSSAVVIPKFNICTGTYDMGTRKQKNIHSIEVETNLTEHLETLIEYRTSNREEFRKSPWYLVNPDGIAYSPCYGVEFRFRFRSFILEQFQIDCLKINGSIHGFSYREYLSMSKGSGKV